VRDQHSIHRLEAFSDIVMGFCIAEMGLNLLIPRTAAQLPSIVVSTNGFILSFVAISIAWWIHHRLFTTFFVLNSVTLILNFAMLGSLVLMVYFQQIALHFMVTGERSEGAVQLWLVTYSVVYALLASMLWIGLRFRWETLTVDDLRWGLSRAILTSVGTLAFVAYAIGFVRRGTAPGILVVTFLVIVAIRILVPLLTDRLIVRRTASS
jgi:uncharacterized membrane protein